MQPSTANLNVSVEVEKVAKVWDAVEPDRKCYVSCGVIENNLPSSIDVVAVKDDKELNDLQIGEIYVLSDSNANGYYGLGEGGGGGCERI